jgi:desulfoferrodoxin (superoxide reductase-like protein)
MKPSKAGLFLLTFILAGLVPASITLANQPTVTIEAPSDVSKGSEIKILIIVHHSANNPFHHVQWVQVSANSRVILWKEYSFFHLPEDSTFRIELKYKITEDTEIRAEASCNFHGSRGPTFRRVAVRK